MSERVLQAFKVGDRVDSIYDPQHRGTVVEVKEFSDGRPMYVIARDVDGFHWIGMTLTVLPAVASN